MDSLRREWSRSRKATSTKMWEETPDILYSAAEADQHLEMIRPILEETRILLAENPGKFPLLEQAFQNYLQYVGMTVLNSAARFLKRRFPT